MADYFEIMKLMENDNLKRYKLSLIVGVLLVAAFFSGIYFEKTSSSAVRETLNIKSSNLASSTIDLDPFWIVWKTLDEKFVYTHKDAKVINDQDKIWGAIEGLTNAYGDPYTVFFPPEESKNFEDDISGNFEGVGMELGLKDKNIVVISPLKDTPAYQAGVKAGDILLSIDGTSTENMSVETAIKLIRGKAGTVVDIKFLREGKTAPIEIKITRSVINVPTVETEVKGDVFVIRLYNFYATSPDKFRTALREFVESGKIRLVLDLRGNPGGYLEAAVDMASYFLPLGKIVVRENYGPNIDEQIYRSKGYNVFNSNLRMVILVDEGSASASEILSGALHEQGVAKLVGTKTFGKGSVQELIKITPDTSLKVTVARWLTPNGLSISDGGLTPDYEVKITDADLKAGNDSQMKKAIEVVDSL
jgi:carboxyl-terminal processing protease